MLRARCLHGYQGPVAIIAVIAPVPQVSRATTRATTTAMITCRQSPSVTVGSCTLPFRAELPNRAIEVIKRRRCAAPGPALPAPGSALGGPPGASAPSQPHLATRSQTACPARILGAAAGLLRRIRSCPSRPSRLRHATRVGAGSALVDPGPRRPGEPVAIRHGNLLVVTGSHVGNRQLS